MRLRQFPATFLNFRNTCFKVSIIVQVKLKVIYSSFIVLFLDFNKSTHFSLALTFTNHFTFAFTFQKIIMLFFAFCLSQISLFAGSIPDYFASRNNTGQVVTHICLTLLNLRQYGAISLQICIYFLLYINIKEMASLNSRNSLHSLHEVTERNITFRNTAI